MARRKRLSTTAVGAVLATIGLTGCWPSPGASPDRQAFNGFEQAISVDNVDTLAPSWTALVGWDVGVPGSIDPLPAGNPIVSKGTVFVTTGNSVHAFDAATGAVRWQRLDGTGFDRDVAEMPGGGTVAFGVSIGRSDVATFVLDARTGGLPAAPLPLGPMGLIDSVRGSLVASSTKREFGCCIGPRLLRVADVDDPSSSWEGWIDTVPTGLGESSVTLGGDRVFHAGNGLLDAVVGSGTFGNAVRSFPARNGVANCGPVDDRVRDSRYACAQWITPLDGTTGTSPVLATDHSILYTATNQGTLYAVDTATGAVDWTAAAGGAVSDPPALAYGTLFVPLDSGQLVAVDAADGSILWSTSGTSALSGQPAVAGGVVFTTDADGIVHGYDAHGCGSATCASLWSVDVGSPLTSAPAISNGHLYVGTEDGRIIAFAPTAEP